MTTDLLDLSCWEWFPSEEWRKHMVEERFARSGRIGRRALTGVALCAALAVAAQAAPPPKVSGNVRVNDEQALFPQGNPGRMTSSITNSPDGQNLLVVYEDLQGLCGPPIGEKCTPLNQPGLSAYSFSTDGGVTWTDVGFPRAVDGGITAGHPWVDRLGRSADVESAGGRDPGVYMFASRMQLPDQEADLGDGLAVYRGTFAANTFTLKNGTLLNSPDPDNNLYSREAIAAAKDGSADAYVVYINVDEICDVAYGGFGQVELFRTHDGGDSWQGPVVVSKDSTPATNPNNPNCGSVGSLQIAPAVAIGPNRAVYTVWQYGPYFPADGINALDDYIAFSASFDGGVTFSKPIFIAHLNAMRENPPVGYAKNRMNDQPRIAVAQSGPHRGRIYVTIESAVTPVSSSPGDQTDVSSQVYEVYSDNRGLTWSDPIPLAPPVPATGLKRIWPTVSVRDDGSVDVVYLESQEVATGTDCNVAFNPTSFRVGPLNSLVDTYWVQSRDGGSTFSAPLKVSTATSNWCLAPYSFAPSDPTVGFLLSNAGDYMGTASVLNQTLTVWPDDRSGVMDTFFGKVTGVANPPHK